MKIVLTGGGTGGHVYPLIAIAEEITNLVDQENLTGVRLYYFADKPFDEDTMTQHKITFVPIIAGKIRVYFSFKNIIDLFKTFFGVISALWKLFRVYPDVVISKGGYVSFPVLFAARVLFIPVIIHESDSVPGRVNIWAGTFAKRIALNFPEAAEYFPEEKIALTGHPIRKVIINQAHEGGRQFFELEPNLPVIGVWGGSQGAEPINKTILELLPELIDEAQIIHQTGEKNFNQTVADAKNILESKQYKSRYHPVAFINDLQTKMFANAVDIIISRAGSSLFEIAAWGKPSILIPYPLAHGDHQRRNAYHYARTGACVVIEEKNMTPAVLLHQIREILQNKELYHAMSEKAKKVHTPDAAKMIAIEALKIARAHK